MSNNESRELQRGSCFLVASGQTTLKLKLLNDK